MAANICDLEQRAGFGTLLDSMPTLVTHGTIYSFEKDRLLQPDERFDVQLVPRDAPVRGADLAKTHIATLTGNGMNISSVGSILVYILSNIVQREKGTPSHFDVGGVYLEDADEDTVEATDDTKSHHTVGV